MTAMVCAGCAGEIPHGHVKWCSTRCRKRFYNRRNYLANRNARLEYDRKYRLRNKERRTANQRKWRARNPERWRELCRAAGRKYDRSIARSEWRQRWLAERPGYMPLAYFKCDLKKRFKGHVPPEVMALAVEWYTAKRMLRAEEAKG